MLPPNHTTNHTYWAFSTKLSRPSFKPIVKGTHYGHARTTLILDKLKPSAPATKQRHQTVDQKLHLDESLRVTRIPQAQPLSSRRLMFGSRATVQAPLQSPWSNHPFFNLPLIHPFPKGRKHLYTCHKEAEGHEQRLCYTPLPQKKNKVYACHEEAAHFDWDGLGDIAKELTCACRKPGAKLGH